MAWVSDVRQNLRSRLQAGRRSVLGSTKRYSSLASGHSSPASMEPGARPPPDALERLFVEPGTVRLRVPTRLSDLSESLMQRRRQSGLFLREGRRELSVALSDRVWDDSIPDDQFRQFLSALDAHTIAWALRRVVADFPDWLVPLEVQMRGFSLLRDPEAAPVTHSDFKHKEPARIGPVLMLLLSENLSRERWFALEWVLRLLTTVVADSPDVRSWDLAVVWAPSLVGLRTEGLELGEAMQHQQDAVNLIYCLLEARLLQQPGCGGGEAELPVERERLCELLSRHPLLRSNPRLANRLQSQFEGILLQLRFLEDGLPGFGGQLLELLRQDFCPPDAGERVGEESERPASR